MKIWLADLTHTQQTIASDVMPAAVGCLAAYLHLHVPEVHTRLFKLPEKLADAFTIDHPDVLGLSNYAWNEDLSTEVARVVKATYPDTIIVMGGPNYPVTPHEQEAWLNKYPWVDYYIVKEGEVALLTLVQALLHPPVSAYIRGVHHRCGQHAHLPPPAERLKDLSEIPSPYTTGLLDEFFDGQLLPIIQTNRGCPFLCTFCVEGMPYYNKIAKTKTLTKVYDELAYIAQRMAVLHGRKDLHIADSNFGMYPDDVEICKQIAVCQQTYGYPDYINVATGKNQKARVLEAASLIHGALRLSGSVQSLDKTVLTNIKRDNIDERQIMDLALKASEIGANSYSEIILGLPGDTQAAHFQSIRTIVEADFNTVCLYQCMLLPGTELETTDSVTQWQMQTAYRIIPRCYGSYDVLGETLHCAEIERIVVANNSLTFDQYLQCRRMHLIINLFYNDGVFKDVLRLLKLLKIPVYEWMEHLYHTFDHTLMKDFLKETRTELWDRFDDLRLYTRSKEAIAAYLSGERGANLIFKYRAKALLEAPFYLAWCAKKTVRTLLEAHGHAEYVPFACDLIQYAEACMTRCMDSEAVPPVVTFTYDVERFLAHPCVEEIQRRRHPKTIVFIHTREQQDVLARMTNVYGTTIAGLTRILAKVYVRKLFRGPQQGTAILERGQTALSGLNEYA